MDKVFFIVYGDPRGKERPRVTNGHSYTPKATQEYENSVLLAYRKSYPDRIAWEKGVPLRVRLKAFYAIPQSQSKKRQQMMLDGLIVPTKAPDTDNVEKAIFDSLNKILFYDDSQIVDARVTKHYSHLPRVEVEVQEVKL